MTTAHELEIAKWICAAIVCILTFIGTVLPIFVREQTWTSRLESLAGGVFLGAGFAHLLEDSTNEIRIYGKINYPISGALAVSTFAILTTIEIFTSSERDLKEQIEKEEEEKETERRQSMMRSSMKEDEKKELEFGDVSEEMIQNSEACPLSISEEPAAPVSLFSKTFTHLSIPALSLYIILDVHSVIEGLALGIIGTKKGVIALACAVGGHKPLEAFALGLILLKSRPMVWFYWTLSVVYVLMSPIGIAIAIYLSKGENFLLIGIFSAISAGTFSFVGCDEWANMYNNRKNWSNKEKAWHLGMFVLGILWMLLIAIAE